MSNIDQIKSNLSSDKLKILEKLKKKKITENNLSITKRKNNSNREVLSFQQQRLWFLDQLVPNNPAYNVVMAFHTSGDVSLELVEKCLNIIIDRHEILRTNFKNVEGVGYQEINENVSAKLIIEDLTKYSREEQDNVFKEKSKEESKYVFDLSNELLIRMTAYILGDNKYIFLLNVHHIIIDGWSMGILFSELLNIYSKLYKGEELKLKPLELQYADYSAWQREYFKGKELERQLAYWKNNLGNKIYSTDLPTDKLRPPVQNFKGGNFKLSLGKKLTEDIMLLSKNNNSTPYMVLMAALNILLYKYTKNNDIVIGTPIANRNRVEIEQIMGFFVNTLVFKTKLEDDINFTQVLDRVKDTANGAYMHQDLPFELLVDSLHPTRDMSYNPLFQVCFVYQNTPKPENTLSISLDKVEEIRNDTSKFDLWIQAQDEDDEIILDIEYNSNIFNLITITKLIDSYKKLLSSVTENQSTNISNIDIVANEDKDNVLYKWNNTKVDYNTEDNLFMLVQKQMNENPNNIAIRFNNEGMTYKELNNKVNVISSYLNKKGVKNNSYIGICMERSFEMITTILAIIKLGAAYVPLDPTYPKDRLNYMIEDSNTPFIIAQSKFVDLLEESNSTIVNIEDIYDNNDIHIELQPYNICGDDIAYMIYTSGSTGKPKGVMNTHKGIINRLKWMEKELNISSKDNILQKTPFSFDVSLWEIFLPLISGATLVLAKPEGHKDAVYLCQYIISEKITRIHFVPSMLSVFLEYDEIKEINSLKTVVCSGEALPIDVKDKFFNKINAELYNFYGPTEAAVDVSFFKCEKANNYRTVPIGKAIANTSLYILDDNLNVVPIGVAGEIYIGGVQVAKGYYNKNDLTAERFINNPYKNGEIMYRTGDLGRYLFDGNIEYIGRIDSQVKIRGFRIELEEIENRIAEENDVKRAIVTSYKDEENDGKIVAYIVANENIELEDNNDKLDKEQLEHWSTVFDNAYDEENKNNDDFNIVSWKSSYSGNDFSKDEMKIWVDTTVNRILELNPSKVLEIGCGTGLLLSRVAKHCNKYVGCDFSQKAISYVNNVLIKRDKDLRNAEVYLSSAEDLKVSEKFDTVVINSVVQYFPNASYLINIIKNSINKLDNSGYIFIGDVRNYNLINNFANEVVYNKINENIQKKAFERKVESIVRNEEELIIAPEFFYKLKEELSEISNIEILLKESPYVNELTEYRYDVILHINKDEEKISNVSWLDYNDGEYSIDVIGNFIKASSPNYIGIKNIKNDRLSLINSFIDKKEYLPKDYEISFVNEEYHNGINPNEWFKLGEKLNYNVKISWMTNNNKGDYKVILIKNGLDMILDDYKDNIKLINKELSYYINNPLLEKIKRIITPKIKENLKKKLPEYMIPSNFIVINDIPINNNGKLDYKALPKPYIDETIFEGEIIEPSTETEKIVSEVWKDVLALDKISIMSDFFELGGDSIKSILVVSKLKKKGIIINPQIIFQNSTIKELSKVIDLGGINESETIIKKAKILEQDLEVIKLKVPDYEDVYPLTAMQDSMIYQLRNHNKKGLYVVHHGFILKDKNFNVDAFREAWNKTLNTFDALRTSFMWEGLSNPVQILHKKVQVNMEILDWTHLEEELQHKKLKRYIEDFRANGYNLTNAPQSQVSLIKKDDETYYFIYFFNLMLQDGWSYPVVITKLFENYDAIMNNKQVTTTEQFKYRKFIDWQQSQDEEKTKKFWQNLLKDVQLPAPKIVDTNSFKEVDMPYTQGQKAFSKEVTNEILELAQKLKTTPYTLIEVSWTIVLNAESNCKDLVFGNIFSGRNNPLDNVQDGVGLFFNLLPVRVRLTDNMTLEDLIKEVQDVTQQVSEYEYTPIRKIIEWCNIPEDSNIFESYLVSETLPNLEDVFGSWYNMGATPFDMIAQTEHAIRFIVFFTNYMGLVLNINYYKCYHTEEQINSYLDKVEKLLLQFIKNPYENINTFINEIK